ncbi:hypothetical protein VTN00DRAFT_5626 [Thermoascus crustaceus]|uniref:uncharacterized protein n=1 Tax=Thermoascus crustaceus TaxID=5088 RepID=UPI00374456A7
MSSSRRSHSKQNQSQALRKKDRNAGGNFEIFSEEGNHNNNDQSGSESEGGETEKQRPLSLVEVNSLLLPTSKAGGRDGERDRERDNRPQKEFCDKENLLDDEAEETDHDEEEEEEESTRRGSTTDNFQELEAEEMDNDEEEEEEDEGEETRRTLNRSLRQPTSAGKMTTRETPKSNSNNDRKGKRKQFSQYRQPPAEIEETDEEEENESEDDGFDSLDDFIVSDNEEISYYDTSDALDDDDDDDDEEENEIKEPPPQPKSRRRLIRGRRPRSPEEEEPARKEEKLEDDDHTDRNRKERQFRLEPSLPKTLDLSSPPKLGPKPTSSLFQTQQRSPKKMEQHSDDNDDLSQHNSSSSESDSPKKKKKMATQDNTDLLVTPPASPSRPRLQSPSKDKHRIPPSPHRESIDEFWRQEVINDWNDQYSPRKDLAAPGRAMQRLLHALGETTTDESNKNSTESTPSSSCSPVKKDPKTPSKTALKKAEAEKKRALLAKKKEFDNKKASFAEEFLKTLDDAVAGGQVQKLAEETGGVKIIWSKTLQTTAGRAKWKREKFSGSSNSSRDSSSSSSSYGEQTTTKIKHHATIELAERIIDCEDRLLNTLAHEYCHLANYMISNIRNNPHGASFKEWAAKCSAALRDHPVYGGGRIEVTTKHSYKIDYKYVWLCVDCGQEYGRHSKSINPDKVRCGLCKGVLQQVKPKPRNVSPRKADNQNNFNKGLGVGQKVEEVMRGIGEVSLRG